MCLHIFRPGGELCVGHARWPSALAAARSRCRALLLAALFVVVREGSRCSARSAARTNDLDADERRRMIGATSGINAAVDAGDTAFGCHGIRVVASHSGCALVCHCQFAAGHRNGAGRWRRAVAVPRAVWLVGVRCAMWCGGRRLFIAVPRLGACRRACRRRGACGLLRRG